jgi:itaconate CoA-transferase
VWTNRSKESLTLDLKHDAAQPVLDALIERADVLVQNLAPGAAARLGLSWDILQDKHPRLIVCEISGYGDDPARPGPYRDKKAYDLLIQSEAGFLSVTGTPEDPVKAGISIADIAAGMYAYSNILAALLQRGQTGRGCRIDVSMLESMAEWMSFPMYYGFEGASAPQRSGAAHATIYPYGPFPAGDGKVVMLGLQNEREWASFCSLVLQQPALANDARFDTNAKRTAARQALRGIIVQAFSALASEQVIARLDRAQIANAQVNDMQALWQHPQLQARQRWAQVQTPAGPVPALLPAGTGVDDAELARMDPVPALGQHTDAILAELGWNSAAIAEMRAQGAV